MSRQSEIRAKWNRKWKLGKTGNDQRMVLDDRGNYVCSVQVYQSPRHMGEYDEDRRIANAALIVSAPSDLRYLLDRLEAATRLLQLAREELAVGRRFLPKHGSFGEEGIDNYEYTQRVVEQFLKESQ